MANLGAIQLFEPNFTSPCIIELYVLLARPNGFEAWSLEFLLINSSNYRTYTSFILALVLSVVFCSNMVLLTVGTQFEVGVASVLLLASAYCVLVRFGDSCQAAFMQI